MLNSQSDSLVSRLSFKEKSNLVSIAIILVFYGSYVGLLLRQGDFSSLGPIVTVTIVFILVMASLQAVLAMVFSEDVRRKSELEPTARHRAHGTAYPVIVMGIFSTMALLLLKMSTFWLFQSALFFLILSELIRLSAELVYLWQQRANLS